MPTGYGETMFTKNGDLAARIRLYPISEGDGGVGGGGNSGGEGSAGGGQQQQAPAFKAPASQEEFDRIIQDRLTRATSKFSDYDELKTKAQRLTELEAELGTDKDKAVLAAREEERTKANTENVPRLVRAEFKAAAKGVLSADQLTALLEDLDLSKYVTDKGDADDEKIEKKVKAFAPVDDGKGGNGNNNGNQSRDLGQGQRQQQQRQPGDQGRAMAEKRFGKKT